MGERDRQRGGRTADVLGAAAAALVVFVAVPAVLVLVVGNPLRGGLGHAWTPASRDALCVAVAAAWVAWAACCAQLVRGVVAHVRGGEPGPSAGASVIDRLAARIAVGILALGSAGVAAPIVWSGGAGASTPVATVAANVSAGAPDGATVVHAVHTVGRGDSLWRIARERLEDDGDWTAIAAHNLGAAMGAGARFVDPDHLRAGWRLLLPDSARDSHGRGAPAAEPARDALDARLPELAVLGAGSLTCAALARRARQRRQRTRLTADPGLWEDGLLEERLSPGAVDTATLLGRFEGVPALGAFEAANVLLAGGGTAPGGPSVRLICVGPDGVTFWLRGPVPATPPEFERLERGTALHVRHDRLTAPAPGHPAVPVALPVGADDQGTWLVALEPGDVLPVLGASAAALWRSARAAQESWAWADSVVVTDDPGDPRLATPANADPLTARRVVFFGHPGSLAPALARRASIVTIDPVTGTDLSVLVDERAATIHPTGRVVRPHLMSDTVCVHLEELTTIGTADAPTDPGPVLATPVRMPEPREDRCDPLRIAPGTVDVRLLTMTPRLDGLCENLPPNRVRRAVELVAYLALHQPDVVTGDRLRTRVLGSADADAAAKTLFNTAHAARRAMGLDENGDPLFPAGSRTGLYQLSPAVTVDALRAAEMTRLAKASAEPDLAIAYYRGALELVEGEPLANALAGYTWWEAEGHAGRIAAVLVDAACSLVALAIERSLFDLARWGLGRARLVSPYSEALSRAAMELAAADGDADGLRVEWRECQRMVDELDPGGAPSLRTETLYGELSRRMLVPAVDASVASDWMPAASP